MKKQQENIKNLLQIIKENPDLKIIPMVDSEIVCDDNHNYWMGSWGNAEVDEYYISDGRIYLKSYDEEDLINDVACDEIDENENDVEAMKKAEEIVKGYDWRKAIIVYIQTP